MWSHSLRLTMLTLVAVSVIIVSVVADSQAAAGNWTAGAGVEYSSGTYGTSSTTTSISIPFIVEYGTESWSLGLIVPYLQVTGDGSVIVSGMPSGRRNAPSGKRTTQSGLGDVVTKASHRLVETEEATSLDITVRIKFGTASKTMGTGENDYAMELSAASYFGDFSPTAMIGYEVLGDTPELPLNNVAYSAVGGRYFFSEWTNAGLGYRTGQRTSDTGYDQREVSSSLNHEFAPYRHLKMYVLKGLSDGSPDTGVGVSVSASY